MLYYIEELVSLKIILTWVAGTARTIQASLYNSWYVSFRDSQYLRIFVVYGVRWTSLKSCKSFLMDRVELISVDVVETDDCDDRKISNSSISSSVLQLVLISFVVSLAKQKNMIDEQ